MSTTLSIRRLKLRRGTEYVRGQLELAQRVGRYVQDDYFAMIETTSLTYLSNSRNDIYFKSIQDCKRLNLISTPVRIDVVRSFFAYKEALLGLRFDFAVVNTPIHSSEKEHTKVREIESLKDREGETLSIMATSHYFAFSSFQIFRNGEIKFSDGCNPAFIEEFCMKTKEHYLEWRTI